MFEREVFDIAVGKDYKFFFRCLMMKSFQIGKIKLKNPLILAPMVDVTDLPYRILCRKAGAALAFTEMIYVDAILHENKKTKQMMKTLKEDSPLGLQITGNGVEEFEEFVSRKELWKDYDLIDLNCGCPSVRITGNEAGSYLLENPEKIAAIIRILKKTGKPITAKIRLGFKKNNVLEVAKMIEKAGADALTVHARLAVDGKDVPADWKWIARVRKEVKIPVIGNGDVIDGKSVSEMMKICDGVMIGRAAIGDPMIFERILNYLKNGKEGEIDTKENLKLLLEYLKLEKKYFGEDADLGKIKYVGGKFFRGFQGAGKKRAELMKCKNLMDIELIFKK